MSNPQIQEIYPNNITDWPQHMLLGTTKNICDAITKNNLWAWVRDYSPPEDKGYMFWNHPNLKLIENDDKVAADGHSGCSWACSMRGAECIAKDGWFTYCQKMKRN
jgi:hypothetical protein